MDFFRKIKKIFSAKNSKGNELEINQGQKPKFFLNSIQNLSAFQRKIVLWAIVVIIGLILLIFWLKNVQRVLKNFSTQDLKEKFRNHFQEELKKMEMPNIEIPQISEEELKKMIEDVEKNEMKEEGVERKEQ